jgi:hypothetical protein
MGNINKFLKRFKKVWEKSLFRFFEDPLWAELDLVV